MSKINSLNTGIPVSISLEPVLEAEQMAPQRQESRSRLAYITAIAVGIAIVISFIAKLLVMLINLFTNISFHQSFSFEELGPVNHQLGILVIIVPVIGGLIVGLMAFYGSRAIRGHGIPEAMEQVLTNKSRIKPAITYLKPLSAAISIGTGGPFGAEGPIIATGGAFGSTIGQMLRISHNERKILLAAGATAGMSAIFGSPVAAIFLAVELLLFEFSPRSLVPVAFACVTGAAGHHLLFGTDPVFSMPAVSSPANMSLLIYVALGLVIGLLSVFVTKAVYVVEDLFEKLPLHWMWWPAIGGLGVGIIGYFAPNTLGVGYSNISLLLQGTLTLPLILSLCILKFSSWCIALGSGTSGGTLAPLLTIGGAAGAAMGLFVNNMSPAAALSIPLCALLGMSAMFAGASRALITSIIFALETTGHSNTLLPLLGGCLASYFISFLLMKNTIMTEKIARRGVRTPHSYEPDILEKISVNEVTADDAIVISSDTTIADVKGWLENAAAENQMHFIVAGAENEYKGMVSRAEIGAAKQLQTPVASLVHRKPAAISNSETLRKAVELMAAGDTDVLPVVNNNRIEGVLYLRNILSVYKAGAEEHLAMTPGISFRRRQLKVLIRGRKLVSRSSARSENEPDNE